MGWYYWTTFLVSVLGMFAGWIYKRNPDHIFWGLVGGFVASQVIAFKGLARLVYSDLFFSFASDEPVIQERETVVLSLTIPEIGTFQLHGLTRDEWHRLGRGVVDREFAYTSRVLQDIFDSQTEGNRIYGLITKRLEKCGVLISGNGYTVSDHIGQHFFTQLMKQDYKVLDLLPPTPVPDMA